MFVKIDTETVWNKERIGAGSVIEVSAEVYEQNKGWMSAVDDKAENIVPPKKEKKPSGDS